ncbi:nitroreductase [Deinococcus altitudinis]|uniref:nitroreductase family protein n=1 Tax=Deinococcus altitudinis TaxID=468914 RepID=UPI003891B027
MPTLPTPPVLPLDLLTTIQERRTVDLSALKPDPIPRPVLEGLLEAANWAPSHGQTEPWRFVVFTGAGRATLARTLSTSLVLLKGQTEPDPETLKMQLARQQLAPVWMVVAAEPSEKPRMPLYEEQWAVACAVQNLMLAARSQGIGSKWISNPPSLHPNTASSLGFAEGAIMMGMLYLGYVRDDPADWPAGKRRPVREKVRWIEDEQHQ